MKMGKLTISKVITWMGLEVFWSPRLPSLGGMPQHFVNATTTGETLLG